MSKPLRLAYLIFVHQNPLQLARLLQRLYCPQTVFYIHIDGKADVASFQSVITLIPSEQIVWIEERSRITWGDFSLTKAYLACFEKIIQHDTTVDYIITISGQDYPIVSNKTIKQVLSENSDCSILDHGLVTEDSPHILERVQHYCLSIKRHHSVIYPHPNPDSIKRKVFNSILRWSRLYPLPRIMPMNHQLYFGTNWFQLKPKAAAYLVEFAKAHPDYMKFFSSTFAAEESFFQTILLNATEAQRGKVYNRRLTYMQWDRADGAYNLPIKKEELPDLFSSDKIFARKFNLPADQAVLEQIDMHIEELNHVNWQ